jgi:hypothetical protein
MAKSANGTYVYCLVRSPRRPSLRRARRGLPGTGVVRLLDADRGLWLVVADAPLNRYGDDPINRRLADLDWVSRAAVAHERVIESFIDASAVLPMKLFTIFGNDDRALGHIRQERERIDLLLQRVANHLEWGVRVILHQARASSAPAPVVKRATAGDDGRAYLTKKKAQRDSVAELAGRARETVATLYDQLAARARFAKRRSASELPVQGGPLLLDAAFLVARSRSNAFRALVGRQARALKPQGYGLTITGPWPPYTFIQD